MFTSNSWVKTTKLFFDEFNTYKNVTFLKNMIKISVGAYYIITIIIIINSNYMLNSLSHILYSQISLTAQLVSTHACVFIPVAVISKFILVLYRSDLWSMQVMLVTTVSTTERYFTLSVFCLLVECARRQRNNIPPPKKFR